MPRALHVLLLPPVQPYLARRAERDRRVPSKRLQPMCTYLVFQATQKEYDLVYTGKEDQP